MNETQETPLVKMEGVCKSFLNQRVNDRVDFELRRGEIHALLGENGAGKTTLMNILTGVYFPDSGRILYKGKEVRFKFPGEALEHGIGMVHQNFSLVGKLTVLENVILGLPSNRRWLNLDERRRLIQRYADQFHFQIDMDAVVDELPIGIRQRVEILKMLVREVDVLIVDEPTTVLTKQEADNLMEILRAIASEGKGVVFISHKMKEVLAIADRITVLRKAKQVGTVARQDVSAEQLARMMVGRDIEVQFERPPVEKREEILRVVDLTVNADNELPAVRNLTFSVMGGEILGIAGVSGNGQIELAEALAGMRPAVSGEVLLQGRQVERLSAEERIDRGVSYIPSDRVNVGVAGGLSIWENLTLKVFRHPRFRNGMFLDNRALRQYASDVIAKYSVMQPGLDFPALLLSGGNLQKLILGREIEQEGVLYICMYPTRGLDVGAMEFVRKAILDLRNDGKAILLISGDLDELFELSDRLAVMYEGEFTGILTPDMYDVERVGLMMSGAHVEETT